MNNKEFKQTLIKPIKPSNRDFPEDYPHENGMYTNTCCKCNLHFNGHKRRVVCKVCDSGKKA